VAVNVALYGKAAQRWTMTERNRAALDRGADHLSIGPSSLSTEGGVVRIRIDERGAPLPRRVTGEIRLHPVAMNETPFAIDQAGRHAWMPIAPVARVEVALTSPSLTWSGHGYWDSNAGDEPIARGFSTWDWSRADLAEGCATLYDTIEPDGARRQIARLFRKDGGQEAIEPPPRIGLPRSKWLVRRGTQSEGPARVLRTLEDTPFYARSLVETRLLKQTALSMHESLDCRRLDTPIVRAMLPFRMPRRFW
jgi:carotenoid 1,2-hydratase